jgi:hypothetical protein
VEHTDWLLRREFRHNIPALGGRLNSKSKRVSMVNGPIFLAGDAPSGLFTGAQIRRASREKAGLGEIGILTCDKSIPSEILPSSLGKEHIRLIEKKNAAPSVGKGEIRL